MSVSAEPLPWHSQTDRLKRLIAQAPPAKAHGYAARRIGKGRCRIVVSVKAKTFAAITALAEAEGTTASDIVRRLVTKALARTARQLASATED